MSDDLLTTAQVAKTLQVDVRTVYGFIRNGELKALDLGHRTKRVRREDLAAFIAERETPSCS